MLHRFLNGHSLTLLWFADLMNLTEEVTIHRPNVSTLLSSAFIRGDLNAATRGPFKNSCHELITLYTLASECISPYCSLHLS